MSEFVARANLKTLPWEFISPLEVCLRTKNIFIAVLSFQWFNEWLKGNDEILSQ